MAIIGEIRNRAGFLVLLFVGVALVAFLLMDVSSSTGGGANQRLVLGKVNGKDISQQEYERRVTNLQNSYRNQGISLDDNTTQNIRQQAWNSYLADMVAEDEYEKLGFKVTDDEMKRLLFSNNPHPFIKSSFTNPQTNQFDASLVRDYVDRLDTDDQQGTSDDKWLIWDNLKKSIKKNVIETKYKSLVKNGSYLPDFLVKNDFNSNNTKVSFDYIVLPYSQILDRDVEVTDAELQTYLDENKADFDDAATRNLDYVEFPLVPSENDSLEASEFVNSRLDDFRTAKNDTSYLNIHSDTPLNTTYIKEENIIGSYASNILALEKGQIYGPYLEVNSYKAAKILGRKNVPDSVDVRHILLDPKQITGGNVRANEIADSLLNGLKQGKIDFDFAANDFSNDTSNKENGGNLGYAKPGQMVGPFNNLIFYTAKVGSYYKVYTQFGIHIVNVLDKKGNNKSIAIGYLTKLIEPSSKTQKDIYRTANEFAGKNRDAASFDEAVKTLDLVDKSATGLKINDTNLPGLGLAREIIKWAFDANNGDVSEVFTQNDKYIVVKVSNVKEDGILTVEGLRSELESAVKRQKRVAALKNKINNAGGGNIAAKADALGVEVQSATDFSLQASFLQGQGAEPAIAGVASRLNQGEISQAVEGNGGVYLISVTDKTEAAENANLSLSRSSMQTTMDSKVDNALLNNLKESVEISDERYRFY